MPCRVALHCNTVEYVAYRKVTSATPLPVAGGRDATSFELHRLLGVGRVSRLEVCVRRTKGPAVESQAQNDGTALKVRRGTTRSGPTSQEASGLEGQAQSQPAPGRGEAYTA